MPGTIFFGVAPPTEAAGIGAAVATLLAIAYRKFSWQVLKEVALLTIKFCGFIFLIATMAISFTSVFMGAGCGGESLSGTANIQQRGEKRKLISPAWRS